MIVLVTGGCGYVGSILVPELLQAGHEVRVIDRMLFGNRLPLHPRLSVVAGDVRDRALLHQLAEGADAIVHLAFLSIDSGYVPPEIEHAINITAFEDLLMIAEKTGIRRLVLASSCSVYGSSSKPLVTEAEPVSDQLSGYAQAKIDCEEMMFAAPRGAMSVVALRAATVHGLSPRQRLDLTVARMTCQAHLARAIDVAAPHRVRPSIEIGDLARLYRLVVEAPAAQVSGRVFNAAFENRPVLETAHLVASLCGPAVEVLTDRAETSDTRSYRVDSDLVRRVLGFEPQRRVRDSVTAMIVALREGRLPGSADAPVYRNRAVYSAIAREAW